MCHDGQSTRRDSTGDVALELSDKRDQRSGDFCGIGLEKEGSALHAAFTLPYSNGPVEGNITKLKYIKRSMYGRACFPLLRQKVLKAA
jgi:transposase